MLSWIAFGMAAWFALALIVSIVIGRAAGLADQVAAGVRPVTAPPRPVAENHHPNSELVTA